MHLPRSIHLLITTPRHMWLRRAIFQVHLWTGIVIGLYTVVIGLTGSALVFRDEIDSALSPAIHSVTVTEANRETPVTLDGVIAKVKALNPGFAVRGIQDIDRPEHSPAIFLEADAARGTTDGERMVFFDRQTGDLMATRERYGGFLGWCANLHYYLLAGSRGYVINGVLAACFAALSLTGWALWWPGWRSIVRALRIHWRARWPRLTWDLHTAGGFWINPALLLVVLTGVMFVFPAPFLGALAILSGGHPADARAYLTPIPSPPANQASISVQQAYRTASVAMPPDNWIGYLGLPVGPAGSYDAIGYRRHGAPYSMPTHVYIDRYRGTVLGVRSAASLRWGLRAATYIYAVHFGSFAGWMSKVLWFLLGLTPAGLLVTGVLMWWRRSLRRTLVKPIRATAIVSR